MPIDPSISPAAAQMRISRTLVDRATEGLTRDELVRAPEAGNSAIWLWAHLTNTRCALARMLGVERELFHPDLFGRGSELIDPAEYPSAESISAIWEQATDQLTERFEELSSDDLAEPAPRDFLIEDKSLAGAVTFLSWHEAYHVGQLAAVRKWLGKGQLVG